MYDHKKLNENLNILGTRLLTEQEYEEKRERVLRGMGEDFTKSMYNYDPFSRAVAELIIRGNDPLELLAEVLIDRKKLLDENIELKMIILNK